MKIDLLIAEIGSTTTLVNAFDKIKTEEPKFIGQGLAPTSVVDGDVIIGLEKAIENLKEKLCVKDFCWNEFMATSSAAGGLKMSVHGLVKRMTVKAAKEAALGAGAVIKMVTAGKLRDFHLEELRNINLNIILLAGGVDYGEEEVIFYNAQRLRDLNLSIPVIYAGNKVLQKEISRLFQNSNIELLITDNVYPEIDTLHIKPTRRLIQNIFARHIVKAPGMQKIEKMLSIQMMPTPGAVMEAAQLLKGEIGNLVVLDVGGATTDVHSVTEDSDTIKEILLNPEPEAKRTVEGDLGVYLNAEQIYLLFTEEKNLSLRKNLAPLPRNKDEAEFMSILAEKAVITAMMRHAGSLKDYYGPGGRKTFAEGKDLTAVKWLIGTGGALTRLSKGREILEKVKDKDQRFLLPSKEAQVLIDQDYLMASLGLMSKKYPKAALKLLKKSLGID